MAPASWIRGFPGALILLVSVLPATAQVPPAAQQDAPTVLERMLLPNMAREQYIAAVLAPLRRFDTDRNGLDAAEIDAVAARQRATTPADEVQSILRYDLNWDGRVTREEVRKVASASRFGLGRLLNEKRRRKLIDRSVDRVMQTDADGDGIITIEEMRAWQAKAATQGRADTGLAGALLALDPDKDGYLTADELTKLARETFQQYDTDGDGVLSADEIAPLRRRTTQAAKIQRQLAGCTLPKPAADVQVAVLGVYEGESVPSVSVAGRDEPTSTGRVVIEPGDRPLYLLLAADDHMIWQIEGDTKRVSRAVVIARTAKGNPGAGVIGLPAGQVTFVDHAACKLSFHDTKPDSAAQIRAALRHAIGHPVDSLAGTYRLLTISMPSGKPVAAPTLDRASPVGVPQRLWANYVRFTPGGLNVIDARTVVSPRPVEVYDVLPGHAGIVQLVQDGAIEPLSDGILHIVKPIARFPAGLNGANSTRFLLANGVPMPAGSPGHSCVISEETGIPLIPAPNCILR